MFAASEFIKALRFEQRYCSFSGQKLLRIKYITSNISRNFGLNKLCCYKQINLLSSWITATKKIYFKCIAWCCWQVWEKYWTIQFVVLFCIRYGTWNSDTIKYTDSLRISFVHDFHWEKYYLFFPYIFFSILSFYIADILSKFSASCTGCPRSNWPF